MPDRMSQATDCLFLQEETSGITVEESDLASLEKLISDLQQQLQQLLVSGRSNRGESKSWLCNALANLDLGDPPLKRRRFAQFLPGGSGWTSAEEVGAYGEQMIALLLETRPDRVRKGGGGGDRFTLYPTLPVLHSCHMD